MILIGSFLTCRAEVFASEDAWIPVDIEIQTLKQIDHDSQEIILLREKSKEQTNTISELEKSLAIEKRTNDLNEREIYLQKKIIEVKDMEIAALNNANDRLKDVSDRAIKLAETSKPSSGIWTTIAVAIGGILLGLGLGL